MILSKEKLLKPILDSRTGTHLSAYIPKTKNATELKTYIQKILVIAKSQLQPAFSKNEIDSFLLPIEKFLADCSYLSDLAGHIGLFRTKESLRIIAIPVDVEFKCVVASSFHIKPLLRWIQSDRDFIFVDVFEDSWKLFHGSQGHFRKVDEFLCDPQSKSTSGLSQRMGRAKKKPSQANVFAGCQWLSHWLEDLTQDSKPTVFFAGDRSTISAVSKRMKYDRLYPKPILSSYDHDHATIACEKIRKILGLQARLALLEDLHEFEVAEQFNKTKFNLFQIAKAAVSGKVKKLVVSEEINIFGRLDRKTGTLSVHIADLDHEDDDILDDIAQTVLGFGGEVVVAKQNEIPHGRPILAIVDAFDSKRVRKAPPNEKLHNTRSVI